MGATAMTMPTYEVPRHAAISPSVAGDVLVCASIGPRGDLIALWSAPADEPALRSRTERRGWASFADPKSPRPVPVRVTAHSPRPSLLMRINNLKLAHPLVQPLLGDKVLVVGARSAWRPEGADRNAVIYDAVGRTIVEDVLGDGIEHVLTTTAGDMRGRLRQLRMGLARPEAGRVLRVDPVLIGVAACLALSPQGRTATSSSQPTRIERLCSLTRTPLNAGR